MHQKKIAIYGSTGSIGKQTLEVISAHPELFIAEILTAYSNDALLIEQALQFEPNIVVIGEIGKYAIVKKALEGKVSFSINRLGSMISVFFAENEVYDFETAKAADNPNFREHWFGTNKLFANAIFFPKAINSMGTESAPRTGNE